VIPLPGVEGRIDRMALDTAGRHLFVSALGNGSLEVLDLQAGKRVRTRPFTSTLPPGVTTRLNWSFAADEEVFEVSWLQVIDRQFTAFEKSPDRRPVSCGRGREPNVLHEVAQGTRKLASAASVTQRALRAHRFPASFRPGLRLPE
jgi:hypothetical protein